MKKLSICYKYKHETLNMGKESPEAKNTKCWLGLLNLCAEFHAKLNWITCFSATLNFPTFMITIFLYMHFIRCLFWKLYILISLRTILKRSIIIGIAKYWKSTAGYECHHRPDCARRSAISVNSFGRQHCLLLTVASKWGC